METDAQRPAKRPMTEGEMRAAYPELAAILDRWAERVVRNMVADPDYLDDYRRRQSPPIGRARRAPSTHDI